MSVLSMEEFENEFSKYSGFFPPIGAKSINYHQNSNVKFDGIPIGNAKSNEFYRKNQKYVKPEVDSFFTKLSPDEEQRFIEWVKENNVPFRPELGNDAIGNAEYDMRGFWRGLQLGDPHAVQAIDPNDNRMHYSDYWKTPYHETFSRESQFAVPDAPYWTNDGKLIDEQGNILFDDRINTPRTIKQ